MSYLFRLPLLAFILLGLTLGACKKESHASGAHENAYMKIMMDMMAQMDAQAQTKDPDHDFATQMVLHHEAAIKMAQEELRAGGNAEMKAIAQRVVVAQQAEIGQFNAFTAGHQPQLPLVPQFNALQKANMDRMMAASDARTLTGKPDNDFAQLMVDHHQAAIDNSQALLIHGREATTRTLAQAIITDQRREITELQDWLTRNR